MSHGWRGENRSRADAAVIRHVRPGILTTITEVLAAAVAGGIDCPTSWNAPEWRIARAVAVIHGVSPLLAGCSNWQAPPGWQDFLLDQRNHTASRCVRMFSLLERIDSEAAQAGIAYVPLKGAALHTLGLYRPGDRPMADIDLLVKPRYLHAMSQLLVRLGYRTMSMTPEEHVLIPVDRPPVRLSEHADNGITIELHTQISRHMPMRLVDITASLWPAHPRAGRNDYPSRGALMGHLLMHAAVNMQIRRVRMIQLHDMALLAPRLTAADWASLIKPTDGRAPPWWAVPPLYLLRRYYPSALPAGTIAGLAGKCPLLLRLTASRRRITEVSMSNPHRALFPALFWSASLTEACRFLSLRLKHGTRALSADGSVYAASELHPWIERSARRRAIDVLLRRPRPETVMMVAAALSNDPAFMADYERTSVA